jgi:hypothetical protein
MPSTRYQTVDMTRKTVGQSGGSNGGPALLEQREVRVAREDKLRCRTAEGLPASLLLNADERHIQIDCAGPELRIEEQTRTPPASLQHARQPPQLRQLRVGSFSRLVSTPCRIQLVFVRLPRERSAGLNKLNDHQPPASTLNFTETLEGTVPTRPIQSIKQKFAKFIPCRLGCSKHEVCSVQLATSMQR